jgi:hypothetical protein
MPPFKNSKKQKNKFDDLPEEFKDAIDVGSDQSILDSIAKTALAQFLNILNKKADQDLASKLELAKEAGAVYREATKANNLKISYARSVLEARGRDVGQAA